jgi:hypothetical protein
MSDTGTCFPYYFAHYSLHSPFFMQNQALQTHLPKGAAEEMMATVTETVMAKGMVMVTAMPTT